ncbi:hypothetical protein ACLKA6_017525 [Drosophila palustris]
MEHSTLPSPHNNNRHLKCLQANLHHAKAASDVLSCRFATEDLDVSFLQEPWILSGHCNQTYHFKKLNLSETETCRFCELEQETSEHVLCECPGVESRY